MPETVFTEKLKKLRKEKNLTQSKLDEKLGFSNRYTSKIESGVKPSMKTLKKLAEFFEVPIEYLISETEEANNLAAVPIRNKELLEAFMDADKMDSEDQKVILSVIHAISMKNKMKALLDGKK
jgi:transcriptional regulator with XRE-family HTH domain